MSKLTWRTDGTLNNDPLVTCSCGECEVVETWSWPTWKHEATDWVCDYCPNCGDRLNGDGTVDSRAELEADAARWRAAQIKEATP